MTKTLVGLAEHGDWRRETAPCADERGRSLATPSIVAGSRPPRDDAACALVTANVGTAGNVERTYSPRTNGNPPRSVLSSQLHLCLQEASYQ